MQNKTNNNNNKVLKYNQQQKKIKNTKQIKIYLLKQKYKQTTFLKNENLNKVNKVNENIQKKY